MDFICDSSRLSSVKNFPLPTTSTRYYQLVSLLHESRSRFCLHFNSISHAQQPNEFCFFCRNFELFAVVPSVSE